MKINLICPMIILENKDSENIRKSDIKNFKLLVDKDSNLVNANFDYRLDLKDTIREKLSNIISSNIFHLEQVFAFGEKEYIDNDSLDIVYLAVTNIENIKNLDNQYKLVDFSICDNKITIDKNQYSFYTKEKINNNNIEYLHEVDCDDISIKKQLLEIIIAYKQLRSKLDNSDIIFKFMPKYFSLEDVRLVYEMVKEVSVDKSNFRKKIVKYCEETDKDASTKGYRPSKLYTFKVVKGDIWL